MINNIEKARNILIDLGFPPDQQNDRSALCLLALLNLSPDKEWSEAENPLMGITPIMDWVHDNYQRKYAPNTRETFRRQTIHQFVNYGIALYNPDMPNRPVNSPHAVYQIEPETLVLLKTYGTESWRKNLNSFLELHLTLSDIYARNRSHYQIPVVIAEGNSISLSPGSHNELIKQIIEEFAPRFAPGSNLVYIGDTEKKWGYIVESILNNLGVSVDSHGKMPDVILYDQERNLLFLIESVTHHGPINGNRFLELVKLFKDCSAKLIFVTAFPNRSIMSKYLAEISWESEVWISDTPSHLIHFNGTHYLSPYPID